MDKKNILSGRLSRGFTLLEALVALLVLSFGLLGVAAMQLKAVQSAHVAYQRSVATMAAKDALERLWVSLAANDCSSLVVDGIGSGVIDWADAWGAVLPELNSSPIIPGVDSCVYEINVAWGEDRLEGESDVSSFVYFVRLPDV